MKNSQIISCTWKIKSLVFSVEPQLLHWEEETKVDKTKQQTI